MMRNQYSHSIKTKTNKNFKFTEWNAHQGREDAQMLQEKCSPKREDTISDTED